MNYRHAYHAGNFADVVKHVLLIELVTQLQNKDKGLALIDAYAGRGIYNLGSEQARKTAEADSGVTKLLSAPLTGAPEAVEKYAALLAACRAQHGQKTYPGSPWFMLEASREQDQVQAFEKHPEEHSYLHYLFEGVNRVGVHQRDAWEGIGAMTPPPTKRGLVFIDPPFESEHRDFTALVERVTAAHKRWSTGVYALWYPIKNTEAHVLFEKKMRRTGIANLLLVELGAYPKDSPMGLSGTGLVVINPPWKFSDAADKIVQYLKPRLEAIPGQGYASVRWLKSDA